MATAELCELVILVSYYVQAIMQGESLSVHRNSSASSKIERS